MQILSAEQTRKADAYTITHEPIKSIDLMERASQAFMDWFALHYTPEKNILVVAGAGNNGGDALAIARLLYKKNYQVQVYLASPQSHGSEDYRSNLKRLPPSIHLLTQISFNCDVIIDGIFGSGIARPITGKLAMLINKINGLEKEIVSIDIASGLNPDGTPMKGSIIKPTYTISFQLPKLAFMVPENDAHVGQWSLVDIGLDNEFIKSQKTPYNYFNQQAARLALKPRAKFAHKGMLGHALMVGGSFGKIGANVLASMACLKAGTGLVTSLLPSCGYEIMQTAVPEVMCLTSGNKHLKNIKQEDFSNYSAIGIGTGIGKHLETLGLLLTIIKQYKKPMVIDADALNLISQNPELIELVPKGSVLTPHVGEFNRLVGSSANSLERIKKQKAFSVKHQLIIVLKGAHTSIANLDGSVWFNSTGNPGMATAGSGDVLTGIITGLLAQGYNPFDAARLGVYLHGSAGDIAATQLGQASVIASDIAKRIFQAFISLN
ncbi:MAG: NAD(P)H-hydrate dehydratase [Cyclobacteriaceae bacterium]|nr:NAD(P)H-hydrate dehydratase [Cyclobacteriaceae bacterium]